MYDSQLEGSWLQEETGDMYRFVKDDDRYKLYVGGKNDTSSYFYAHLTEIDNHRFIDLFPARLDTALSQYLLLHFVPVHSFALIDSIGDDAVTISPISLNWLTTLVKRDRFGAAYESVSGFTVFTAKTARMRTILRKALRQKEQAFAEPYRLERQL